MSKFYETAAASGISKATYNQAFAGITGPDEEVLEKARYQPEFKSQIWDYLDSRVNPYTVKVGREMLAKHNRTLTRWSAISGWTNMSCSPSGRWKTNYGAALQNHDRLHHVPQALATLAWADPNEPTSPASS